MTPPPEPLRLPGGPDMPEPPGDCPPGGPRRTSLSLALARERGIDGTATQDDARLLSETVADLMEMISDETARHQAATGAVLEQCDLADAHGKAGVATALVRACIAEPEGDLTARRTVHLEFSGVPGELAAALADRMFDDAHENCDEGCHGTPRSYYDQYARALLAETILPAIEAEVTRLRDELEDAAAPVDDLREQLAAARERAERFQDERDSARDALAEVVWERDAARETAERWRYVQNRKKAARELTAVMDRAARRGQDRVPCRRTEQDGGIPNDAYTADDYPKGM